MLAGFCKDWRRHQQTNLEHVNMNQSPFTGMLEEFTVRLMSFQRLAIPFSAGYRSLRHIQGYTVCKILMNACMKTPCSCHAQTLLMSWCTQYQGTVKICKLWSSRVLRGIAHQERSWQVPILSQRQPKVSLQAHALYL